MTHRRPPKPPRPTPVPRVIHPGMEQLDAALRSDRLAAREQALATVEQWAAEGLPLIQPAEEVGPRALDGADAPLPATTPQGRQDPTGLREYVVTFLVHAEGAEQVLLFANRLSDEADLASTLLSPLGEQGWWHASFLMRGDWRASYCFITAERGQTPPWLGAENHAQLRASLDHGVADPHHRRSAPNRVGRVLSVVELPQAPREEFPTGPEHAVDPEWAELPEGPRFALHRCGPTGPGSPVAVLFDGEVWAAHGLPSAVERAVAAGRMAPIDLVLLDSGGRAQRWQELDGSRPVADQLADHLLPEVSRRLGRKLPAESVAVSGQSLGGLSALLCGLQRPDAFTRILSQSASLWLPSVEEELDRGLAAGRAQDWAGLRIDLAVGDQEWVLTGPHERLAARLEQETEARLTRRPHNGGHDYAWWRVALMEQLCAAFPGPRTQPLRRPLPASPRIPEEAARSYREAGYWTEETFPEFFDRVCRENGERTAVIGIPAQPSPGEEGQTQEWTYARLSEEADRVARRLRASGVLPGDRVLLQLPNAPEYAAHLGGIFRAGALPVFCLPQHTARELASFAERCDAAAHVFAPDHRPAPGAATGAEVHQQLRERMSTEGLLPPVGVPAGPWEREPEGAEPSVPELTREAEAAASCAERPSDRVGMIQLSGGTTGTSKLIPRTAADYLYSVRASAEICELTPQDVFLVSLPAAHNFTMSSPGIMGFWHVGAAVVFAADPSPGTAFGLVQRHGVTVAALVPALAQAWLGSAQRRRPDLSSLRMMQVGGAKLAPSVAERIGSELGVRLQQVFGMAEGLVNYTRPGDSEELVQRTQGRPISPADEVLILDDADRPVPEGESGHLLTRGPYTIRGYLQAPQANRESFTPEGFYRTGDLVRWVEGNLQVTGRAKDQINRGGEKIAVDEVEDLVLRLPGVEDAVLVGLPDPALGQRVGLVVVPRKDAGTEDVEDPEAPFGADPLAWFRESLRREGLAEFKLPERVFLREGLPLTNVGKAARRQLRQELSEQLA